MNESISLNLNQVGIGSLARRSMRNKGHDYECSLRFMSFCVQHAGQSRYFFIGVWTKR